MNRHTSVPAGRPAPPAPDPPSPPGFDEALARLEDVLCQELDRYRDLLDVMREEKRILTANETESLPGVLEEQKVVLHDAKALEPRRIEAMRTLADLLGMTGALTLSAIAEKLTGEDRIRVDKLREALVHVVPQVDKVNRINTLLIRNSMNFVSQTVRSILEESTPLAPTYAPGGSQSAPETVSWTDRRA